MSNDAQLQLGWATGWSLHEELFVCTVPRCATLLVPPHCDWCFLLLLVLLMLGMRGRQKKVSEKEPVPLLRPVPMLDVCVFGRARYCHDVHGQTKRGRSTLGLPRDDYVIARKRKESDVKCRGWHET